MTGILFGFAASGVDISEKSLHSSLGRELSICAPKKKSYVCRPKFKVVSEPENPRKTLIPAGVATSGPAPGLVARIGARRVSFRGVILGTARDS